VIYRRRAEIWSGKNLDGGFPATNRVQFYCLQRREEGRIIIGSENSSKNEKRSKAKVKRRKDLGRTVEPGVRLCSPDWIWLPYHMMGNVIEETNEGSDTYQATKAQQIVWCNRSGVRNYRSTEKYYGYRLDENCGADGR
jgi:hypothetical protein